jgi:hypothetical protein
MLRKTMLLASVCVFLLGGCFPGPYISRQAASGAVVDSVTGEPLPGVQVFYGGEKALTDEQGAFSFSKRVSIGFFFPGGEHPAWPHWGYLPLDFEKDGYVPVSLFGPSPRADGKVALEPSHIPEGIAALDERITEALVMRLDGNDVLVSLTIMRSGDFGSFENLARETRAIGEKVVRSGLAGAAPDLAFHIRRPRKNESEINDASNFIES